jgi:hypothetical protein
MDNDLIRIIGLSFAYKKESKSIEINFVRKSSRSLLFRYLRFPKLLRLRQYTLCD